MKGSILDQNFLVFSSHLISMFYWSALQIQMKGSIMDHTIYTFVVSVDYNRHLWMYYGSYNFVCVDACPTKQLKHGECHIR